MTPFATESTCIRIKNLRLRTFIGINDDEISKKQDIIINASIWYDGMAAAQADSIEQALNYKTITKKIIHHVESRHFHLLEKLTQDVIDIVMEQTVVREVEIEVDKPHALRFADSVSLTAHARRQA